MNIIYWDLDPKIIVLFNILPIRYYGLFFISGIILAYSFTKKIYIKEKVPVEDLEKLLTYLFVGMFVGMRLGHCLFYDFGYYSDHLLEIFIPFKITNGQWIFTGYTGLASHGGLIGVLIAVLTYTYKIKSSFLWIVDRVGIGALLTGAFIRMGNFMNSEIYGKPTNGNYGVVFMKDDMIPRHPTQLYEAFSYLVIFGILLFLYRRRYFEKNGVLFGLTLSLVFTARFIIEFYKENQVLFEDKMPLNMGQLLSIPFIFAGIVLTITSVIKKKYV